MRHSRARSFDASSWPSPPRVPAEPPRTVKSPAVTISFAAADAAHAFDRRLRREARQLRAVVLRVAGEPHELAKAAGVGECVDAFAHREFAAAALARDALGTAHLLRESLPQRQFVHFVLPAHCDPPFVWNDRMLTISAVRRRGHQIRASEYVLRKACRRRSDPLMSVHSNVWDGEGKRWPRSC